MALIGEIVMQSKIAERFADQLEKASERIEYWSAIQSILIAASNVSKILWPIKKEHLARGKHLRKLLEVDEDHLLSDRTIRNHFEHYDERIQNWLENNQSSVYFDLEINPLELNPWSIPRFFHRSYNPPSKKLSFRNESIDLGEIITKLIEIRKKCSPFTIP